MRVVLQSENMKQLKIPTMKAHNLEELQKVIRESTIADTILFWKRYENYFNVESYLQEAMDNAQEIQKIVRKLANAPQENSNLPSQSGVHNANNNNNGNGNGNGNDNGNNVAFQPNAGGNINGNGNGGNNNGNGGGAGVGVVFSNENPRIWMLFQRYDVNYRLVQRFHDFALIAKDFDSWEAFANAVYQTWVDRNTDVVYPPGYIMNRFANAEGRVTTPANCWPGGITVFGRIDNFGYFTSLNWPDHEWETVRMLLNCVRIYEENAVNGY
ncbi:hypothetical protein BVRB_2g044400 [Beta vulgaris subsp. vulgaris]|nr:hypothetical protein BVRB_2g044400 [Beta vulgaris subsp. vulgaris]